jgi:hypothetical protein
MQAGLGEGEVAAMGPSISQALQRTPDMTFGMGYSAWIGFYNSNMRRLRWQPADLVEGATMQQM